MQLYANYMLPKMLMPSCTKTKKFGTDLYRLVPTCTKQRNLVPACTALYRYIPVHTSTYQLPDLVQVYRIPDAAGNHHHDDHQCAGLSGCQWPGSPAAAAGRRGPRLPSQAQAPTPVRPGSAWHWQARAGPGR